MQEGDDVTCKARMSPGMPTSSYFAARDRQEMAARGMTAQSTFCTRHHTLTPCWQVLFVQLQFRIEEAGLGQTCSFQKLPAALQDKSGRPGIVTRHLQCQQ